MSALYEVVFGNADGTAYVATRVRGDNVMNAIAAAISEKRDQIIALNCLHTTKTTEINEDAEAAERVTNAPLWSMFDDVAQTLSDRGFVQGENAIWRHPYGTAVIVDPHAKGQYKRFVSIGAIQLTEAGNPIFSAYTIIPWYGDGLDHGTAVSLLRDVLRFYVTSV